MNDVNVILINFPTKAKEMVTENEDGSYTILINARLSYEAQLEAYKHAMKHIENDDFRRNNVQQIEAAAHSPNAQEASEAIPADKYLERLELLRKRQKQIKCQIKKDAARVEFLQKNKDMFSLAENHWLYGDDL